MNQNQDKKWTKTDIERYIAQKFCKHLADGYKLLDAERESPDCLISINGKEIGLELVEVRRSNARDRFVNGFQEFELFFQKQSRSDSRVLRGLIDVTPRYEASRKTGEPGKYRFPHQDDHGAYYEELITLAQDHMPETVHEEHIVCFRDDHPEGDRWFDPVERPKIRWIAKQRYPRLYGCFECFSLLGGGKDLSLVDVEFRPIALEENKVRRVIRGHHEKLEAYRKNLQGCDIWLLLYTEGTAATRRICEKRHIHEIEKIYRDMDLAGGFNGDDRFDEVWLGTNVLLEDLPEYMAAKTICSPKAFYQLA